MRHLILILSLAGLAFAVSCTDAAPPVRVDRAAEAQPQQAASQHDHKDDGHDAPRISLADAKKEFDAGTAVFVDTHSPQQFAVQHIPGAINIPANDVGDKADKLPKGKKIIAYCS